MLLMLMLVAVKISLAEAAAGPAGDASGAEGAAGGRGALDSEDNFLKALVEEPPVAARPAPLPAPGAVGSASRSTAHSLGSAETHDSNENLFKVVEEYLRIPGLEEYIENVAMKSSRRYGGYGGYGGPAGPRPALGAVARRLPTPSARGVGRRPPHSALRPAHHRLRLQLNDASFKERELPRDHAHNNKHKFLADGNVDDYRVVNEPLYRDEAVKKPHKKYLTKMELERIRPFVNMYLRPTYRQQKRGAHLHRVLRQGSQHVAQTASDRTPARPMSPQPAPAAAAAAGQRPARVLQPSRVAAPVSRPTATPLPPAPARAEPAAPPLAPSLLLPTPRSPPPPPPALLSVPMPTPMSVPVPVPATVPIPIPQIIWSTLPQTETTTSTIRHKGLGRFMEFIKKNRKILMRLMGNKRIEKAQAGIMGLQETAAGAAAGAGAGAAQRRARARADPRAVGAAARAAPHYEGSHARNPNYNQNMMSRMNSATRDAYHGRMVNVLTTTKHIPSAKEIAQEKEARALLARLQASAGGGGGGGGGGPVMRVRDGEDNQRPRPSIPVKVLDMAPAKGSVIADLRSRGRLCQRHILNPEGPKYRHDGAPYVQAFRAVRGRDFARTRAPRLLIPICCNCCVKSVLGCQ